MSRELIIREPLIFLEQDIQFHQQISLKLCYDRQIYKFHHFNWNRLCQRWQAKNQMKVPWPKSDKVELEVYSRQDCKVGAVLGEGWLSIPMVQAYLQREIKIALMYDGVYVGALYCEIHSSSESDDQMAKNFLYMHKIEIVILEEISDFLTIQVHKNNEQVYEKEFYLPHQSKSLFPNLKIPVKMSDVFTFSLQTKKISFSNVKFLADNIHRGKTSSYEVWLRNKLKSKVGQLKVQYFLQNIFLENDRQIFARNGIYPSKPETTAQETNEQEKDKLKKSCIIKCLEEADKRILKINKSVRRIPKIEGKGGQGKQMKQTLHKLANYSLPDAIKQNKVPNFRITMTQ